MAVCEALIGKPEQIATIVGYKPKAPFSWRRGATGRDAGDLPSTIIQRKLLDHSDAHDLGLTPEHLIRGAEQREIDAILAARRGAQTTPLPTVRPMFRRSA